MSQELVDYWQSKVDRAEYNLREAKQKVADCELDLNAKYGKLAEALEKLNEETSTS